MHTRLKKGASYLIKLTQLLALWFGLAFCTGRGVYYFYRKNICGYCLFSFVFSTFFKNVYTAELYMVVVDKTGYFCKEEEKKATKPWREIHREQVGKKEKINFVGFSLNLSFFASSLFLKKKKRWRRTRIRWRARRTRTNFLFVKALLLFYIFCLEKKVNMARFCPLQGLFATFFFTSLTLMAYPYFLEQTSLSTLPH